MDKFEALPQEKKERILSAALEEFAGRSYQDASTNAITKAAEISKGALFHYFGSKENLYNYLMEYTSRQIEEKVLTDFPKSDDLIDVFYALGERKAALAAKHPLLFEFLFRVFQEEPRSAGYKKIELQATKMMHLLTNQQIDTSRFREGIDLEKAIEICTWMSDGFGRKYALHHAGLDPQQMLEASKELMQTLRTLIYKEESQ